MTTPTPTIQSITHGTLKLGGSTDILQIECWTNAAALTQSTDMQDVKTLCPDSTGSAPGTSAYSLEVTYYADEQDGAPSEWLFDHHATLQPYEFAPYADNTPLIKYTGSCYVMWGGAGGASGELPAVDVVFPCTGKPARTSTP